MAVFRCRTCETRLTDPVTELADASVLASPSSVPVRERRGEDYIPEGVYTVATRAEHPRERDIGRFVLNTSDVSDTRVSEVPGRASGCCGLDGVDGPNVCCENGHEVGTERSDCWTLHYVAFDPTLVSEDDG